VAGAEGGHKFDHVVSVMFENRTFDNLLGRLYQPGEVPSFEGVIGKDLSNPIPEWAEHGADRKVVPYGIAANMNTPNPDSGEEFTHINTQLFGIIDPPGNRGVMSEQMTAPSTRRATRTRRRRWTGSSPTTSACSPRRRAVSPPTRNTPRS
jgi:phospholipase C